MTAQQRALAELKIRVLSAVQALGFRARVGEKVNAKGELVFAVIIEAFPGQDLPSRPPKYDPRR